MPDHIPQGHLDLRSAYARYKARFGVDRRTALEAMLGAFKSGKLIALVQTPGRPGRDTVRPEFWRTFFAERVFLEPDLPKEVDAVGTGSMYAGRTPFLASPDFEAWLKAAGAAKRPGQMSSQRAAIGRSVYALWPGGVPETLQTKSRNDQIRTWVRDSLNCPGSPILTVSDKTIQRYFKALARS